MQGSCLLPVVHEFHLVALNERILSRHLRACGLNTLQIRAQIFFVLVKGHLLEGSPILQVLGKYPWARCKQHQISRKRRLIHAGPLAHKKFQHVHYLDAIKRHLLRRKRRARSVRIMYADRSSSRALIGRTRLGGFMGSPSTERTELMTKRGPPETSSET
ncbi:hypothetical protein PVAP13_6NG090012 [Panicum virgatum]|uniref:Uncharacterized protein n=1 Tax=Panicum virgatum TaxID=38727 RepID=A0A8T0QWM4_PANVG|nr:hypothetical protein PVAP13_6NG090012 [Panicum virgatum]